MHYDFYIMHFQIIIFSFFIMLTLEIVEGTYGKYYNLHFI